MATAQLDPNSDVWVLCPNYMETVVDGVVEPSRVALMAELKRKKTADLQPQLPAHPAVTKDMTEQTGETEKV